MSVNKATILEQTPHRPTKPFTTPFGILIESISTEVRTAIYDVVWDGSDPAALKLIAYGLYAGALDEVEAATAVNGSNENLIAELEAVLNTLDQYPDEELDHLVTSALRDRLSEQLRPRDDAEGWALTLLELISIARPSILPVLLKREGNPHFILRWILQTWTTNGDREALVEVLLERPQQIHWTAAAALLTSAARVAIDRNGPLPNFLTGPPEEARLVALGTVLTTIFDYGRSSRLNEAQVEKWNFLVDILRARIVGAVTGSAQARSLRDIGSPDDTTLIALILEVGNVSSARTFAEAGDLLLRSYFRPLKRGNVEQESLPYLAPLVINDLANIWVSIGADSHFFEAFRSELRCDEYAFAFTYGHYLTDRARAIVLAAIGAVAGATLGDSSLSAAATALADDLHALPEGVVAHFDAVVRLDLESRTGIVLPAR